MLITGAACTGAGSALSPPKSVDNHTPPAVTTVPATPIIVFFKPDQVPSDCSTSSDIVFVFNFLVYFINIMHQTL
jgi:hypothetical protein